MKKIAGFALLALMAATTGCSYVSSGMPGMTPATGEAWYTKDTGLGPFLIFSSKVMYCPKDNPTKCVEAEMREE